MVNLSAGNIGKIVVAVGAAIVASELGCLGTSMAINDAEYIGNGVKETANPTPYLVKEKGLFGKKSVVKVNPFTQKVTPYTGSKKPVNKKPIKITKVK